LAAARERVGEAIDLIVDWAHGPVGQVGGNRAPGLWLIESAKRLIARSGPGVLASDLAAADAYRGALEGAAKIACPTLVVIGAEDRMTPAKAGMKLAAAIPGARQATIPACGHMMMLERPEETLAILRSAL
ncbi:MAG: alpha/beta fold hydrolase, partial [Burkholderiales bacterium]